MSQSRGTAQGDPGIGDQPEPFGAWEKFQLGWLDYDVVRAGRTATVQAASRPGHPGASPTAWSSLLPDKHVPLELGAPCADCGSRYFYSDQGNDLDTTMTRDASPAAAR